MVDTTDNRGPNMKHIMKEIQNTICNDLMSWDELADRVLELEEKLTAAEAKIVKLMSLGLKKIKSHDAVVESLRKDKDETINGLYSQLTAAAERERELNHVVDHMVRESGKQIERERVLVDALDKIVSHGIMFDAKGTHAQWVVEIARAALVQVKGG